MNFFKLLAKSVTIDTGANQGNVDIPVVTGNALLTNVLNIVYFILGAIAVVIIILAGYHYLTANGEPGKASKAMQTILYAAIGLIVVIFAFAITNFVMGRV
jgi:VIT1/CCC1 family predicted Fe2+/Mn2+ transporter